MSDIRFLCPACGSKIAIESGIAGFLVRCPVCAKNIRAWNSTLLELRFLCPECRGKLIADVKDAGKTAPCPHCKRTVTLPAGTMDDKGPALPAHRDAAPERTAGAVLTDAEVAYLTATASDGDGIRGPA
jgi:predicted Zn finger-like uncharacterized protein